MLKKTVFVLMVLIFASSACFAMRPAVVGGIRKNIALGVYGRESLNKYLRLQTGIELNTSATPVNATLGLGWYLDNLAGHHPLILNTGLVVYAGGSKTEAGLSGTLIFERFLDVPNLFLETGVDVTNSSGYLVLQLGYKL